MQEQSAPTDRTTHHSSRLSYLYRPSLCILMTPTANGAKSAFIDHNQNAELRIKQFTRMSYSTLSAQKRPQDCSLLHSRQLGYALLDSQFFQHY